MSRGALAALREDYWQARERNHERFRVEADPRRLLEEHTRQVDRLVRRLVSSVPAPPFAVLGTGGYGRRELYPCSDVDLLFVFDPRKTESAEGAIRSVLHQLWDVRLQLGHQVWSLEQLQGLTLEQHLEVVLSLLDARFVCGSRSLGRRVLQEVLPLLLKERQGALVEQIVLLTRERHAAYQNTIYQLEPDLKEAPGGLRDFQAASWLLRLEQPHSYLPYTAEQIQQAHAFLQQLRIRLHLLSGRNQNQLTHALQEALVEQDRGQGKGTQGAVESLMKEYFLNARVLYGFCQQALREADPSGSHDELSAEEVKVPRSLSSVLGIFRKALREQRPLSPSLRRLLVQSLPQASSQLHFPSLRRPLRELFEPRTGLYSVLSEMYELGFLELLFPEFGSIKAHVIRDFYHRYTVDEHTLLAIKNVEDLLGAERSSDRPFRALLEETSPAYPLTLALLLHDVGKSREGRHSESSARMATKALRRFRFSRAEVDLIVFLIRHHLAMSTVIFRRDLEDPAVVRRFAELVQDVSRLRYLTLLTYADIKAVGPGTLNDWKKDLLWQLYVSTYRKLTLGYGEERIEEEDVGEKLREGLPAGLDPHGFEQFLEGFPRGYLASTPPSEVYEHYRLASRLTPDDPLQLHLVSRRTHYEMCVVTPDRYRLFAKIVGLLSYFGMNILRGYGFANRHKIVLDFFQFTDLHQTFRLNPGEQQRFQELLRQAVKGEVSVQALLERKETSVLFQSAGPRFPPTVYFEEEHSEKYTILEIVAPDSIGLLYRISREISRLRCNIELVLISTEGEKAVDVFYLSWQGGKLPAEVQRELADNILRSIG